MTVTALFNGGPRHGTLQLAHGESGPDAIYVDAESDLWYRRRGEGPLGGTSGAFGPLVVYDWVADHLDTGRWERDDGDVSYSLPIQADDRGEPRKIHLWGRASMRMDQDTFEMIDTWDWYMQAMDGGRALLTADDLEAATRIIRWHEQHG